MTTAEMIKKWRDRYEVFCNGNQDAFEFLVNWHMYCHAVDDIIDWPKEDKKVTDEMILAAFALAGVCYSTRFYAAHAQELLPVVLLVTNAYADSVNWEHDPVLKRQYIADVMRHAGNEMVMMVAYICGGWDAMRKLSPALWERSYDDHHEPDGRPK